MKKFLAVVFAGCLALTACTSRVTGASSPVTGSSSPVTGSSSPVAEPVEAIHDRLTISFAGDTHFERQASWLVGKDDSLASLRDHATKADLTILNLETALATHGKAIGKTYEFHTDPSVLGLLRQGGVDAVSMANNHAADWGPEGLEETLKARETSPIPVVGIGRDEADALKPAILEAKGVKVAVIGIDQIDDETTLKQFSAGPGKPGVVNALRSLDPTIAAIKAAKQQADVVVVYPHWGVENTWCASGKQQSTAKALAQAGADIVVGGHAHRPQGAGWMGETFVGYGLGNFLWFANPGSEAGRGGYLTVQIDVAKATAHEGGAVVDYAWQPTRVGEHGLPQPSDDAALRARWEKSVACSGLSQQP